MVGITPITQTNLFYAVDLWISDQDSATNTYGNISDWDVSGCTSMNSLFSNKLTFNADISRWNVSNVTDMYGMFYGGCTSFDADISRWNVCKVTSMQSMFYLCTSFSADISGWNVVGVTDMYGMFEECTSFDADISRWNVWKVTDMGYMFYGCSSSFNPDISKWDVRNIPSEPTAFGLSVNLPVWGTWPSLPASLTSLSFDSSILSLYPLIFAPGTFNYAATNLPVSPYIVTLTPTAYSGANTTITVNSNSVISGSPITLTLVFSSINTITIVSVNGTVTCTYVITLPAVTTQAYNVFSAFNTVVVTNTQRFQINLDKTTSAAPMAQFVQDISQNSTGYTSNSVTQRFIFGSCGLTNPLELNSTVNSTGTSLSSNVKAGNYLLYSDIRLKENIKDLSETQGVDNIKVVQYNNKSDNSKHFGVIAQELAEIYPELVQGSNDGINMQSVSYVELIPICINVIQILKKKQRDLRLRLDILKRKLPSSLSYH